MRCCGCCIRFWKACLVLSLSCPELPLSYPTLPQTASVVQVLVEQLRQKCLEERVDKGGDAPRSYSALTQSPREWALEPGKPCGGERLLLMIDCWCAPLPIKGSIGSLQQFSMFLRYF